MSAITRTFKRVFAEIAYSTGNYSRADLYVTEIAAERITKALNSAKTDKPFVRDFELGALERGVKHYETVRGELEARIKPALDDCTTKGLGVTLEGQDAWCSGGSEGTASVRVRVRPLTQGTGPR